MYFLEFLRQVPNKGRLILGTGFFTILLMQSMHSVLDGVDLVSIQLAFTPSDLASLLAALTEEQLAGIRYHYLFDMVYPIFYSLFFSFLMANALEALGASKKYNALMVMPLWAGFLDLIENSLVIPWLGDLSEVPSSLLLSSSLAASAKWILLVIIWGVIFSLYIRLMIRFLRIKN